MTLHFYRTSDATRLRALIKRCGLSQRGAARALEISDRELRYMCAGTKPVPRAVFLALTCLLDDTPPEESGGAAT